MTLPKRRTRYLVQRRFQLKYAGWLLVVCALVGWLAGATVYVTAMQQLGSRIEQIYPQSRAVSIFQTTQWTLARNLLWLIPVLLVVSVGMSHKIAGPLVRIKRMVDEVGAGDVPSPITLRKRDELQDLAASLNAMGERLRSRTAAQHQAVGAIRDAIQELSRLLAEPSVDAAQARRLLEVLEQQVRQLNNISAPSSSPSQPGAPSA